MKVGDFVVWRYHDNPIVEKTTTYFGIFESIETFHYKIRNLETGEVETFVQPHISIVFDKKYEKINTLDKNRLYSRQELVEMFGDDPEPEREKFYVYKK